MNETIRAFIANRIQQAQADIDQLASEYRQLPFHGGRGNEIFTLLLEHEHHIKAYQSILDYAEGVELAVAGRDKSEGDQS